MDAIKFLKGFREICFTANQDCKDCVMSSSCCFSPNELSNDNLENMVAKVEDWYKKNPPKTRQSEFLKIFPNPIMNKNNYIDIFPCEIDCTRFGNKEDCVGRDCDECRREYWFQEVD